jgi:hypothetical protein
MQASGIKMQAYTMKMELVSNANLVEEALDLMEKYMFVIPVPFAKYHRVMLAHCKELLEYRNGYMSIHLRFSKLLTALRTAIGDGQRELRQRCSIT